MGSMASCRFVVFALGQIPRSVVSIVRFHWGMRLMRGSAGGVHVGRIKNHAINLSVFVRKIPAINSILNVRRAQVIVFLRHATPEDSPPVRHVSHRGTGRDVELENAREDPVVSVCVGAQHKVIGGFAVMHRTLSSVVGIKRFLRTFRHDSMYGH